MLPEWLESRYTPEPNTGCWFWTSTCDHAGYPYFSRRKIRVSRAVLEAVEGPLAPDECACHRCDTPSCVNPAHLFRGTRADNVRDMMTKGRQAKGEKRSPLTPRQMVELFERRAAGEAQGALAARFGVHQATISRLLSGKRWKDMPTRPPAEERRRKKLSPAQVAEMRRRAAAGEKHKVLAAAYGVRDTMVSRVVRGLRWPSL